MDEVDVRAAQRGDSGWSGKMQAEGVRSDDVDTFLVHLDLW